MKYIYLVCTGDCESHGVEAAFLSEQAAKKYATEIATNPGGFPLRGSYMVNDRDRAPNEILLFVSDDQYSHGRLFGYVSVEEHRIIK